MRGLDMDLNEFITYINEASDSCSCLKEEVNSYLEHADKDEALLRKKLLAVADIAIDSVQNAKEVIKVM